MACARYLHISSWLILSTIDRRSSRLAASTTSSQPERATTRSEALPQILLGVLSRSPPEENALNVRNLDV